MQALSGTPINLTSLNHLIPFKIARLDLSFPIALTTPVSPNSNLMPISQALSHDAKLPGFVFFTNSIAHQSTTVLSYQLTAFQSASVMRKQVIPHVLEHLPISGRFLFRQRGTGMICPPTPCTTPTPLISRPPLNTSS
ncbi:unnamed protein product, partial [Ixodes hexagonus]